MVFVYVYVSMEMAKGEGEIMEYVYDFTKESHWNRFLLMLFWRVLNREPLLSRVMTNPKNAHWYKREVKYNIMTREKVKP